MTTVAQVKCPFCNAAHAASSAGSYTCEFCLQPFSVQDAKREEARLLDEIKAWVEQRVGAAGPAASVDLASRAYIFQQRVLPDLRRDVDRALERIGGYGQFPLVTAPVGAPAAQHANPLVARRREILALKGLKARLSSEDVTSFASRDADRLAIQLMDRHLTSLVHLSNIAGAAASRSAEGYAAARRNLEVLGEEIARSVATEGAHDPPLGAFLAALQRRYAALGELCRICEESSSPNAIAGAPLADRADALAARLGETAQEVEASNFAPADAMPVVVAVNHEMESARAFARWLRAYGRIAHRSSVSFPAFVADVHPLTGGGALTFDAQTELLETFAFVLDAARGVASAPLVGDFSWVDRWAEAGRRRKSLGLFGVDERVTGVERFLSPFWVADVFFSRAQGSVFASGKEERAVALLDACAPDPHRLVVLGESPLVRALETHGSPAGTPIAAPRSSPSQASAAMMRGLHGRSEYLNPRLRVRGLAFLPVAAATYAGGQHPRTVTSCLADQVPADRLAREQVQTTQQMLQRYR